MNRIDKKFQELKKQKKKALIVFLTAGDPGFQKNEELILAFERDGVDLIELGVPFSDPLADGPVIQASSQRALKKKANLKKILALVKKVRKKSGIPIILMSYLNPVMRYGYRKFASDAKKAGVDGMIFPDLPPEEGKEIAPRMAERGLSLIYLLAPTSTAKRRTMVTRASQGFIYYVSITGVTGMRHELPKGVQRDISRIKRQTKTPVCVGFGISKPSQAREMAKKADGVILGSAAVHFVHHHAREAARRISEKLIRPFAVALGKRNPGLVEGRRL